MKRPLAPGDLALVQAFVNTLDIERGQDEAGDPVALGDWLCTRGLLAAGVTLDAADLAHAHALREALRALLASHDRGEPADAAAVATVNALSEARLRVAFATDGAATLTAAVSGLDGAVARLLAIVYAAQVADTWPRLKVCRRGRCRWAFYDASKNQSGAWCDMRICGNREKAQAYKRRRRLPSPLGVN